MKKLIVSAILGLLILVGATSQTASAQMSDSQIRAAIENTSKELPMKISESITWESMRLLDDGVIEYAYSFDPTQFGVDIRTFAQALNDVSSEQMLEMLGEEFKNMAYTLGRNIQIIYKYPDGTRSTKRVYIN